MRNTFGSMILACSALCLQTGCSHLPGRETMVRLGLPSPAATIAAAEKREEPPTNKRTSMFGGAKESSLDLAAEIARGQTYERDGDYDKARKVYEEVRQRHPNNVEAAHRLGIVADAQKRHSEAEQLFRFGLSHEPNNAELMSDLGYCLFLQGKLVPAAEVLSGAVEIAPTHVRARNNLGVTLGHMGDYESALALFAQGSNEADAFYNLAYVYASQEKTDEAKACFALCLQIDSGHARAREALVSINGKERQPDAMLPQLANGVHNGPDHEAARLGAEINGAVQQASAQMSMPSTRDTVQLETTRLPPIE